MTVTKMSLHRIIAQIKNLELKVGSAFQPQYVTHLVIGNSELQKKTTEDAKKLSQTELDKFVSNVHNLAILKSARNKANSEFKVTIASVEMTIDEALSKNASIPQREQMLSVIRSQFAQAQASVDRTDAEIDKKVNAQITAFTTSAKPMSKEQIALIRTETEKDFKREVVYANGLKETIEKMAKDIEDFKLEVDYVLSEANATNFAEVELI